MEIKKIGVIGAGQMGRGIAQVGAFSGHEVLLYDVSKESLDHGFGFIKKQLSRGLEKGKWDNDDLCHGNRLRSMQNYMQRSITCKKRKEHTHIYTTKTCKYAKRPAINRTTAYSCATK